MHRGLYIHIPYCRSKCIYCDFYSQCDLSDMDAYVHALCRQIAMRKGTCIDTIFVGGGTPGLLSGAQWATLGGAIHDAFDLDEYTEFTVECNPDSTTETLLGELKAIGVNRLSVGVQSLQNKVLDFLHRRHNAAEALACIQMARGYFDNINVDYMVGLPHQDVDSVRNDVRVLAARCKHMSVYTLQVEEGTPLWQGVQKGQIVLPDDDATYSLFEAACDAIAESNYDHYEVSNFARRGYQCRHNLNCWMFEDYIGIGAAAHGFENNIRYHYPSNIQSFIKGKPPVKEEDDSDNTRKFEMIMLALRTQEGLDIARFNTRFNTDFTKEYAQVLLDPVVQKTTLFNSNRFSILPEYLYTGNQIILKFLKE